MFCFKCGKKLPDNAMFCNYCGAKVPQKPAETLHVEQETVENKNAAIPQSVQRSYSTSAVGSNQKTSKSLPVVIGTSALLIVTVIVVLIVFATNIGKSSNNDAINSFGTSNGVSGSGNVNSGNTLTDTVTLKQFLDSGPKVGFYGTPNKSDYPLIYLFEDGKVYAVCPWTEKYEKYFHENYSLGRNDGAVTWGDIAKMSDDELLEFARKNKQLNFMHYYKIESIESFDAKVAIKMFFVTGDYTLHIYTDSTGNNFVREKIEVEYEYENYISSSTFSIAGGIRSSSKKAVIYDSTFIGLDNGGDSMLYFRTDGNLTIVPDKLGTEGVETD